MVKLRKREAKAVARQMAAAALERLADGGLAGEWGRAHGVESVDVSQVRACLHELAAEMLKRGHTPPEGYEYP
jgi:hypothetical protein